MAIQTLNVGSGAGAGDGEGLRSSQVKVNSNFAVAENAASKIVQASSADTTADKVMLSDFAWRGAQLGDYFTYGGTANAITLTSANLKAGGTLIAGMKFRFKATTTNTGATTISVDGGAATACVTPTGVALPAGFIRTDVITECEYDGSNWVVYRKIEKGSNANGLFTRFENGRAIITKVVTGDASGFVSTTLPISLSNANYHVTLSNSSSITDTIITEKVTNKTGATFDYAMPAITQAGTGAGYATVSMDVILIGNWFE